MSAQPLPLVSHTDVLVIGGTAAAAEFALAARAAGRSVLLATGYPYVGDDICAELRLWPHAGDQIATPLAAAVFADGAAPPTPLHVKVTLEQALVEAGIEVLLNTHPVGVLKTADGAVGGVLIGNRAGRQACAAGLVVDATPRAQVAGQAAAPVWADPTGERTVRFVALGAWSTAAPASSDYDELPGFAGSFGSSEVTLQARAHRLQIDFADGSYVARLRAYATAVSQVWAPGGYLSQERLNTPEPQTDHIAADVISAAAVTRLPGLIRLGAGNHLNAEANAVYCRPPLAMAVGRRLGEALAAGSAAPAASELQATCAGAEPLAVGALSCLDVALRPGAAAAISITVPDTVPRLATVDVAVIGGGTGGAPAALGAAGAGASVLLVESTSGLGGVGTMGQIANYWYGNKVGFTSEIDAGVAAYEDDERVRENDNCWSVPAKKAWYHDRCAAAGVDLAFGAVAVGAWVDGGRVRGVVVAGPDGYGLVAAGCTVDATGCADVAAAAGAPTVAIGSEHVAVQGTDSFSDDTDVVDASAFLISSKLKFREHFDAQQLVDSRERRQIVGDIELSPVDFLYTRRFPDTICVSSSNFDTHGFTTHPVFWVQPPHKDRLWVDVPYRALLPRGLDGVLVTGLGVSAHRDAIPVIRMQADVQNHGYAAGRAAAMAAAAGCALRDIDLRALQQHLVAIGNLPERVLSDVDNHPLPDDVMAAAVREQWDAPTGLAVIFADPDRSIPLMSAALADATDAAAALRYALCLALLGDTTGAPTVRDAVVGQDWDDGWNYRGMGQFGMSLSEVDALIVALGTAGDATAWPVLQAKIAALPEDPAFSHCRALVLAAERLYPRHADSEIAGALAAVLARPGMAGHSHTSLAAVQAALTDDRNENGVRNDSLRELLLARGIYRCGDHDGIGRSTLAAYVDDLRGHYARHARAVLAES
jgi:hypothetical protein